jgi:hypothetical protein
LAVGWLVGAGRGDGRALGDGATDGADDDDPLGAGPAAVGREDAVQLATQVRAIAADNSGTKRRNTADSGGPDVSVGLDYP